MEKKKATFSLSKDLLNKLNDLPRNTLPDKSELVEKLLREWLKKQNGE